MDTAVALVEAYLEFCGYFVLSEVPVRKRVGDEVVDVTDVDILALHFPRTPREGPPSSSLELYLGRDPELATPTDAVDIVIGEVKEGKARVNDALDQEETVSFALRRVGCCPEDEVPRASKEVVRGRRPEMHMPSGLACRPRVVVFAGRGEVGDPAVHTVRLAHCAHWIRERLRHDSGLLAGAHFKQDVLGTLALLEKLED